MSGGVFERYRYTFPDGRAKDWAIRTNPDGTFTTRWGVADRLAAEGTRAERFPGEAELIARSKLRKGYVLLDRVPIDPDGRIAGPATARLRRAQCPPIDFSRLDTGSDDFWF